MLNIGLIPEVPSLKVNGGSRICFIEFKKIQFQMLCNIEEILI